jgi:hypothetical protein
MRGAVTFSELPAAARFQIAILGPVLVGAICGFLLGESAPGWWIAQAAGAVGGVGGGLEHQGARRARCEASWRASSSAWASSPRTPSPAMRHERRSRRRLG